MKPAIAATIFASIATVGATAIVTAPAAAQTGTGQIGMRGFVSARCGVNGESGASTAFSGTISLGELSDAEARLRSALINSTSGSPAGTIAFQAGCTGTAATVTLSATRLSTPSPVAAAEGTVGRSEEHTSELQSLMRISYAVSCWTQKRPSSP